MNKLLSISAFVLMACQFSLAQSDQQRLANNVLNIAGDFMTGAANKTGYFQSVVEMAGNLDLSGSQEAAQQEDSEDVETYEEIAGLIQEGKEISSNSTFYRQLVAGTQGMCPSLGFRLRKRQLPNSGIKFVQIAQELIDPPPQNTELVDIQDRYQVAVVLLSIGLVLAFISLLPRICITREASARRTPFAVLLALTSLAVGFLSSGLAADLNDKSYVAIIAGLVSGVGYLIFGVGAGFKSITSA